MGGWGPRGSTGVHRGPLESTGVQWGPLGSNDLHWGHWGPMRSTAVHRSPLWSNEVHWGPMRSTGATGVHRGPMRSTEVHWGPQESTGVHWDPLGSTEVHWQLKNLSFPETLYHEMGISLEVKIRVVVNLTVHTNRSGRSKGRGPTRSSGCDYSKKKKKSTNRNGEQINTRLAMTFNEKRHFCSLVDCTERPSICLQ